MERLQHDLIKRDLPKEMVLLIGSRQVGKTYLPRQIAGSYSKAVYLNYDNIARSLVKEPKLYFYDNGMVKGNEGVCFENLMAVSLLKHANALEDYHGRRISVQYIRTKEKKEVDFVLAGENEPVVLIETKLADTKISPSLRYFHERYHIPAVQVVRHLRTERMVDGVELRRAFNYLSSLHL